MSESARDRYTEMLQQGYDVDVIRQAPGDMLESCGWAIS